MLDQLVVMEHKHVQQHLVFVCLHPISQVCCPTLHQLSQTGTSVFPPHLHICSRCALPLWLLPKRQTQACERQRLPYGPKRVPMAFPRYRNLSVVLPGTSDDPPQYGQDFSFWLNGAQPDGQLKVYYLPVQNLQHNEKKFINHANNFQHKSLFLYNTSHAIHVHPNFLKNYWSSSPVVF